VPKAERATLGTQPKAPKAKKHTPYRWQP
jgi:hypothetical protein